MCEEIRKAFMTEVLYIRTYSKKSKTYSWLRVYIEEIRNQCMTKIYKLEKWKRMHGLSIWVKNDSLKIYYANDMPDQILSWLNKYKSQQSSYYYGKNESNKCFLFAYFVSDNEINFSMPREKWVYDRSFPTGEAKYRLCVWPKIPSE